MNIHSLPNEDADAHFIWRCLLLHMACTGGTVLRHFLFLPDLCSTIMFLNVYSDVCVYSDLPLPALFIKKALCHISCFHNNSGRWSLWAGWLVENRSEVGERD